MDSDRQLTREAGTAKGQAMRFRLDPAQRQLLEAAQAQGFTLHRTRSGHVRVSAPDGGSTVTSSTPSDRRTVWNTRSRLRRLGLDLNTDGGRKGGVA